MMVLLIAPQMVMMYTTSWLGNAFNRHNIYDTILMIMMMTFLRLNDDDEIMIDSFLVMVPPPPPFSVATALF